MDLLIYVNKKKLLWDPSIFEVAAICEGRPSLELLSDKYIKSYCFKKNQSDFLEHDKEFFDPYNYSINEFESDYNISSVFHSMLEIKEYNKAEEVIAYGVESILPALSIFKHVGKTFSLYINDLPFPIEELDYTKDVSLKRIIKFAALKADQIFTISEDIKLYLQNVLDIPFEKIHTYQAQYSLDVLKLETQSTLKESLFFSSDTLDYEKETDIFDLLDENKIECIYCYGRINLLGILIRNSSRYDGSIYDLEDYLPYNFYREVMKHKKIFFLEGFLNKYISYQFLDFLNQHEIKTDTLSLKKSVVYDH